MELYKIYVATKKKDGTVVKSDFFIAKADNKDDAIKKAIGTAKAHGYRGKIYVCSVFIRNEQKQYTLLIHP